MSELLLENDLDSDSKELVYYIHDSAKNLLAVVNDLLDFSKLEAGRVELAEEILSVQGLIENVIHSVMPDAHKKNLLVKGSVGTEVSNDLVGDACRIRQVLLNLTHNAVKFTASGSVHITADVTRCSEEIVVVRFEVKDTGIGIGAEPLATLFKPFVQADGSTTRKYGGTGLGLSICKALVELMSGELGVDSLAGAGSTFWFSIPLKSIDRIPEAEPTIFRAAS
jgi:signal transduction histidine kinase